MTSIAQKNYTKSAEKMINEYRDRMIVKISVGRTPVAGMINKMINILSLGSWDKLMAENGIEKFYHLFLLLGFSNGINITYEKNDVLTISRTEGRENDKGAEMRTINLPRPIKFIDFIERTRKLMGNEKYFGYDALGSDGRLPNNCQDFVIAALQANGLLTPGIQEFVHQNIEQIAANSTDITKNIIKAITDISSIASAGISSVKNFLGFRKGGYVKAGNVYLNPKKPVRDFSSGTKVRMPVDLPKRLLKEDCVPCVVETGELVIPLRYVDMTEKFLKCKGVWDGKKFL